MAPVSSYSGTCHLSLTSLCQEPCFRSFSPLLYLEVKYVHNLSAASEHFFCLFLKLISALREKICPFKNEIRLKGTFNLSGPESFISLEKWILSTHLSAYIKASEGTAV